MRDKGCKLSGLAGVLRQGSCTVPLHSTEARCQQLAVWRESLSPRCAMWQTHLFSPSLPHVPASEAQCDVPRLSGRLSSQATAVPLQASFLSPPTPLSPHATADASSSSHTSQFICAPPLPPKKLAVSLAEAQGGIPHIPVRLPHRAASVPAGC